MGDADHRAGVRVTDELETIDGAEPRERSRPPSVAPVPRTGADYPELLTVDRRHYKIEGEIAKGGMGRVLAARDLRLGRAVAIKELLPKNRDAARRFEREARITARLQHPGIIHIYEAAVWNGGEPFYAMPHVEGLSLDKVVAKSPSLAERIGLLPHVIAVADALAYAHNENVIHRDLKPANVLVGAFGETVVIDWGLAKDLEEPEASPLDPTQSLAMRRARAPEQTSEGSIVGTPAYMPPEQARGDSVDRRADVYSLGALLYHVLVGKPPYTGTESNQVIDQVKAGPCPNIADREPNTPADLVAIVTKAMERDPYDRYPDAAELARDLKKFQNGQLVAARRYSRRELVVRWLKRNVVVVGISSAAVAALAIVAGVSISRILDEKRTSEQSRYTLLEERGRSELIEGQAGRAIPYLYESARDGERHGARQLLIADALRPFEAQLATFPSAVVAFRPNGEVLGAQPFGTATHTRVLTTEGQLITVDDDRVIRVWSPAGQLERELKGFESEITDAHVDGDETGSRLIAGSVTGQVFVWDVATGHRVKVEMACGANLPVVGVRMSPTADHAVLATDDNKLCLFDARTGRALLTAEAEEQPALRGHKGRLRTIRWNQARKLLLTASDDGTALIWDPFKNKSVLAPLVHDGRAITSAEWSSDGHTVVTAGADHVARLWQIPDAIPENDPTLKAKEIRKLVGHAAALGAAVFDPKERRVATAGDDNKAKVWDVASGELIATFEHADVVSAIAFSPDGNQLLTASNDGSAKLWNLAGGVVRASHELDSPIQSVAVADGVVAAAATDDNRVTIWRGNAAPLTLREHDGRVFAIAYSHDGRLASGGEDAAAIVWDATGKLIARTEKHDGPIRALAFAPDGDELATAGDEGKVRLWVGAKLVATFEHGRPIIQLAYSPDGAQLLALGDDGRVVVWTRGAQKPVIYSNLTTGKTRAFAFSRDGRRLVVAGTDTKIYGVINGVFLVQLIAVDGPTGEVRTVAFTSDGAAVITAGSDGLVQLWDTAKGKLLGTRGARGGAIQSLAVTPDGNTVWAGGADQLVRGWDIHAERRDLDELAKIVERSPWRLEDDVVRLKTGGSNGQH